MIVQPFSLCRASIIVFIVFFKVKFEVSENWGRKSRAWWRQQDQISATFNANRGSAQRNGFHYPILVFYAESDSVTSNDSYQYIMEKSITLLYCGDYIDDRAITHAVRVFFLSLSLSPFECASCDVDPSIKEWDGEEK